MYIHIVNHYLINTFQEYTLEHNSDRFLATMQFLTSFQSNLNNFSNLVVTCDYILINNKVLQLRLFVDKLLCDGILGCKM